MKYPILFALLTALFWGLYGPALGQASYHGQPGYAVTFRRIEAELEFRFGGHATACFPARAEPPYLHPSGEGTRAKTATQPGRRRCSAVACVPGQPAHPRKAETRQ